MEIFSQHPGEWLFHAMGIIHVNPGCRYTDFPELPKAYGSCALVYFAREAGGEFRVQNPRRPG